MEGDTSPIHDLYRNITSWKEERFAARMYKARYIDKYIRDYFRDAVVTALLDEGYRIDVAGARWEMYNGRNKDRLVNHSQCVLCRYSCNNGKFPGGFKRAAAFYRSTT